MYQIHMTVKATTQEKDDLKQVGGEGDRVAEVDSPWPPRVSITFSNE